MSLLERETWKLRLPRFLSLISIVQKSRGQNFFVLRCRMLYSSRCEMKLCRGFVLQPTNTLSHQRMTVKTPRRNFAATKAQPSKRRKVLARRPL